MLRTISSKLNMKNIQGTRLSNITASRKQNDKYTWQCTHTNVIHIAYSGIILAMRGLFYYLMFSEWSMNDCFVLKMLS